MRKVLYGLITLLLIIIIFLLIDIVNLFKIDDKTIEDNPFTIEKGQTVNLKDYNMKIKLLKINDSRCPKDMQCIWAGEITYEFVIKYKGKSYKRTLSTNNPNVSINDKYSLEIVAYNELENVTLLLKDDKKSIN